MSDKRAGGIVASSFVAGLLLAAGIFAPRAWEPVPEPFFGLEDPASQPADGSPAPTTEVSPPSPRPERLAFNEPAAPTNSDVAMQAAAVAAREALAAAPPQPADAPAVPPPVSAPLE
jgi:hypothetical protein